jgi:TonB family protein
VLPFALLIATAQIPSNTPAVTSRDWPTIQPLRVTATPDWSDYRIYPNAARKKNQEGRVIPDILVGADGKPIACRIVKSSNFPDLDAGSCKLMMEMRFDPARDSSGISTISHYSRPLIWILADERPFASSKVKARLRVENGRQVSCDVIGGEGPYVAPWSAMACLLFRDTNYFFGNSADRTLDATIEVRLDAGDRAAFLSEPWPAGEALASQRISFSINAKGDATECTPIDSRGFGRRDLNNMSPCGNLLSSLWFARPIIKGPQKGVIETRVYALDNGS